MRQLQMKWFTAVKQNGAYKNGSRLPNVKSPSTTLIDNYPEPRGIAAKLFDKMALEQYVESGSLGLKICRIAEGSADIFVKDVLVKDWDLAAPELILHEAGGILTGSTSTVNFIYRCIQSTRYSSN